MGESEPITPFELLHAYSQGMFPMAMSRAEDELYWFSPEMRGVLPLSTEFNVPRSMQKILRNTPFSVTFDQAFNAVISRCSDSRDDSWINEEIIALYTQLHHMGHAHSVECWVDGDGIEDADESGRKRKLVGGLYGISLGSAFFGESMFSLVSGASKVALVKLVEHLRAQHYTLLDTQYVNDHLRQFGVQEIPREQYLELLSAAIAKPAVFGRL